MNKIKLSHGSLAFLLAVISSLVIQFLGALFLANLTDDAYDVASYVLMAVLQGANIVIALLIFKKTGVEKEEILLPVKTKTAGKSALVLIVTLISSYMLVVWINLALERFGVRTGSIRVDGYFFILALIVTGILAPIGEEIVYRFILLSGLREKFSPFTSICLSAFAFAFMHFNPYQTVYQIVFGIVLGLVVTKSGNIAYSIIMHALNNVIVLLLALLPSFDGYLVSHGALLCLAIMLFVVGMVVVFFIFRSKDRKKEPSVNYNKRKEGFVFYLIAFSICLLMWALNFMV